MDAHAGYPGTTAFESVTVITKPSIDGDGLNHEMAPETADRKLAAVLSAHSRVAGEEKSPGVPIRGLPGLSL